MDKEGARLTTYRFTSPSGGVFSYTVENDSEPGGGVEEMEAWEAEEASRDMWKKTARQQVTSTSYREGKQHRQFYQMLHSRERCAMNLWSYVSVLPAISDKGRVALLFRLWRDETFSLARIESVAKWPSSQGHTPTRYIRGSLQLSPCGGSIRAFSPPLEHRRQEHSSLELRWEVPWPYTSLWR